MINLLKIVVIIGLASLALFYLRKTLDSVRTFQWYAKLIIAGAIILILGILIGIF